LIAAAGDRPIVRAVEHVHNERAMALSESIASPEWGRQFTDDVGGV